MCVACRIFAAPARPTYMIWHFGYRTSSYCHSRNPSAFIIFSLRYYGRRNSFVWEVKAGKQYYIMPSGGKQPVNRFVLPRLPDLVSEEIFDHQGLPAYKLWYPPLYIVNDTINNTSGPPPFSFQIYISSPFEELRERRQELVNYLFGPFGGNLRELAASLEVYVAPAADPFSCVDHQRQEIAHRKQNAAISDIEAFRIPRYRPSESDTPHGQLILITSARALERFCYESRRTNDPDGPLLITFDRQENVSPTDVALASLEGDDPSSSGAFETLELRCNRKRKAESVTFDLVSVASYSCVEGDLNYGSKPETGMVGVHFSLHLANDRPTLESVDIDIRRDHTGSLYAVFCRWVPSGVSETPDLQYLVYVSSS